MAGPLEIIAILTAALKAAKLAREAWDAWRPQRGAPEGLIVNSQGGVQQVPVVSGIPSVPDAALPYPTPGEPAVTIHGGFLIEESLDWLQGDEVILLLIIGRDFQAHGQFYLFGFDFDGYAVNLWPDDYFIYAFVLDPEAPSLLEAEIIAVGFPDISEDIDPNPITVSGYGVAEMNILVLDRLMFPDAPRFLNEL